MLKPAKEKKEKKQLFFKRRKAFSLNDCGVFGNMPENDVKDYPLPGYSRYVVTRCDVMLCVSKCLFFYCVSFGSLVVTCYACVLTILSTPFPISYSNENGSTTMGSRTPLFAEPRRLVFAKAELPEGLREEEAKRRELHNHEPIDLIR
jgi:hypothetical protein